MDESENIIVFFITLCLFQLLPFCRCTPNSGLTRGCYKLVLYWPYRWVLVRVTDCFMC